MRKNYLILNGMKFYSPPLSTIARSRGLSRKSKISGSLFVFLCICLKLENSRDVLYFQEQELNLPPNCIASADGNGVTSEFTLKKGWRTSCGKEFELIHDKVVIDRYWDKVSFLRPNAVSEGFLTSLSDLVIKTNFEEYRIYGNFAELALRNLFDGEEVRNFIKTSLKMFESCLLVVATASFGAQDTLHQPLNIEPRRGVCYVAFVDAETRKKYDIGSCEHSWNVLELPKLVWGDPRMKTRIVRALLPFYFPYATFSVWVDSKLQLKEDPVVLVHQHLQEKEAWLAVSENHVRSNIFDEGGKLEKMFRSSLSINKTYDDFRVQELRRCLDDYRKCGFSGVGLPDAGLFLRAHTTGALEFSLRWTQEILKYPFGRDQISFPFVVWKYSEGGVNLFNKCLYVQAVREIGHATRSGIHES